MLKLYHCENARSFRPLWTMEEMGLSYELKMLPFPPRVHDKSYLQINLLGTIPAFFDDDILMTESAAICQYLASRHGPTDLDVPVSDPAYGTYLNWLHFSEATLTFPQTLVVRYGHFEAPERRLPQVVEDYKQWFLARLRAVDTAISARDYLCADRFTTADISVGYALMLAEMIQLAAYFPQAVAAYWQRLKQRPGYLSALERQRTAAAEQGISRLATPLYLFGRA